jgi:hypothetical protein
LMAAGADLARVYRVEAVTGTGASSCLSLPRDVDALAQRVREVDAALLALDPLLSRLDASLDTHKDAEVRQALEPLVQLADDTAITILGLIHVNKSGATDPLSLVMGSRAFAAVARAVLFAMVDPDDEHRRLLGQPKNNLGSIELPTLAYHVIGVHVADTPEGEVRTGKIEWLGNTSRTISEAIAAAAESGGDKTATTEAADWLSDYLTARDGSAESADIKAAGKTAGHTEAAMQRARGVLRLVTKAQGFPRRTVWLLSQSSHGSGETTTTTTRTTGTQSLQSCQSLQSHRPPARAKRLDGGNDAVF